MNQAGVFIKIFARDLRLAILEKLITVQELGTNNFLVLQNINRLGTKVGIAQKDFVFQADEFFVTEEKFVVNESIFSILLPENVGIDHGR